jgi:hypothetical protein
MSPYSTTDQIRILIHPIQEEDNEAGNEYEKDRLKPQKIR